MKRLCFSLAVCLIFSFTDAQKSWNLQECIDYAHENNIQVKREKLKTLSQEKDYQQSKYDLLPNLGARLQHELSSGKSLIIGLYEWEDKNIQQGNMSLYSSVTLFNGLQNYNRIKMNELNLYASLENLERVKNNISLNIATYYLQILFDQELLEVAKSQLELTSLQVERTQKLVDVGNIAQGELLKIQAQQASEQLNVINAENQLKISYLNLTQLLDLDSVGDFTIENPKDLNIGNMDLESIEEVYSKALANLPRIKSAEYLVQSSGKALQIAKGGRYPQLNLEGYSATRYEKNAIDPTNLGADYPFTDQLGDNNRSSVTLSLYIPIFNKRQISTNIQKAKIDLQDLEYNLEQEKQFLYKEIQQAHADATNAYEKFEAAKEAVKSNEQAFNYTQQKFEVGLVNSLDYNIANNDLLKAKSDFLTAKYEYIFKTRILDFYMGNQIVL